MAEFFRLMKRQFTAQEWVYIEGPSEESEKLRRFYRLWSLKESYVKAIGIGLGMDLQRINFLIQDDLIEATNSSRVEVDGVPLEDFSFQEFMLDRFHCVTTAAQNGPEHQVYFLLLDFPSLIEGLEPLDELNPSELESVWRKFRTRDNRP